MPYTLALTGGAQAQNEGNGGGGASWTYTLTRTGADIDGANHTYSFQIFNADTTPSDDFASATGTFIWIGGDTTTTVTFTALQDVTVEANENPIIWFRDNATSLGPYILSNQHIAGNVITITNDDTGAPVFSTPSAISVAENLQAVATVTAASGGTTITYAKNGGADAALFNVDANTGALTFVAAGGHDFDVPADAGGDNVYNVIIRATGGGATTDQAIAVTLTNVNEAPVITSNGGLAAATGVGPIAENTLQVLAGNTATDVDAGDTPTWSISGGADAARFTINASTGALSFASNPNFEAHADAGGDDVFDVTIRATDAGGLFDEQTVAFTLTNVNDPSVITSYGAADLLFLNASENTPTSTTLATVTATDDESDVITWSVVGPDSALFTAVGGELKFAVSPDFELPGSVDGDNTYDVTVQAASAGGADNQRFLVFVGNVAEAGETGGGGFVLPTPPTPPPTGGASDDSIAGTAGADSYAGGAGNDTIDGADGNDMIDGDAGADQLFGGDGSDFIRGLGDNDIIDGGAGADTVNGNLGQDTVAGGAGADVVYGGQGNDLVNGGDGDDSYVNGNMGDDIVHGDYGNDSVYGGQNNDTIYGDEGDDFLSGDLGNDLLFGGNGADRFAIGVGGGNDWVADFNYAAGDRIQLAPGTAYTVGAHQGQVVIFLTGGEALGLVGVGSFSADYVVFA